MKIIISHQNQCDSREIEKLISFLREAGFDVEHGSFNENDFIEKIARAECYVCVIEQNTHQSKEIAREVIIATKAGKRIFAIFCPSLTTSIDVPSSINNFAVGVTEWNPAKLADGLTGIDIGFSDQEGRQKKNELYTKPPSCK